VVNCKLEGAAGDAIAIAPASDTDPREEVSDIAISWCHLLDSGRSGVSNQRLGKRLAIVHNRFVGTKDQDIDFEPTGDLPGSGPSGYLILGNTMVRRSPSVSVTLSGITPEAPSRQNTFAYNQIYGGQLGLHDAQDLSIIGNYIEAGPKQSGTVVRVGGAVERLLFFDNMVVRPRTTAPGTLINVSSEPTEYAFAAATDVDAATDTLTRQGHRLQTGVGPLRATLRNGVPGSLPTGLTVDVDYWAIRVGADTFKLASSPQAAAAQQAVDLQDTGSGTFLLTRHGFPHGVSIRGNRLSTYARLPEGEALVNFTNASAASFRNNELTSFAGTRLGTAVRFESRPQVRKGVVTGWEVVGNHVRGDAAETPDFDEPGIGTFGIAVSMVAGRDTVRDVRVSDNTFAGCETQVRLQAEAPGAFTTSPAVSGNLGVGTPLALQGLPAVLVGGNLQSADGTAAGPAPAGARYCGPGEPAFDAPIGSLYSRSDGASGSLLYVNVDGLSTWTPIA
jgi:hypothetical protein